MGAWATAERESTIPSTKSCCWVCHPSKVTAQCRHQVGWTDHLHWRKASLPPSYLEIYFLFWGCKFYSVAKNSLQCFFWMLIMNLRFDEQKTIKNILLAIGSCFVWMLFMNLIFYIVFFQLISMQILSLCKKSLCCSFWMLIWNLRFDYMFCIAFSRSENNKHYSVAIGSSKLLCLNVVY